MVVKYKKGDRLIYPHHGACTVEQISKISAFDVKQEYLTIRVSHSDLLIKVPVNNAESVGLRDVINDEEVEEVFTVLRKKDARTPTNWSRRFKNHSEKMRSGDIYQVAEVVRNLTIRNREHRLSNAEKHMLVNARQVLVSELTFALNIDLPATEARLTEVLA
jgi:CarD family transcriptional regulator